MFQPFPAEPQLPGPGGIGAHEQVLLWAWRRLVLLEPPGEARCHAVESALHRQFGDNALAVGHALRCTVMVLARRAPRTLRFGQPCCPMLVEDEWRLLLALRLASRLGGESAAAAMLTPLSDSHGVAALLPLLAFLADVARPDDAGHRPAG